MKALVAFIVMAVLILVLIEINERIKAKKPRTDENCPQPKDAGSEACSECALIDVCEKEEKSAPKK
jgi:hypothetical protein